MPISDAQLRAYKPKERAFKVFDGGGLYIEVTPSGGKLWRLKYRFDGKEHRLAFGAYPEVPLRDARIKRDTARRELAAGCNPSVQRKLDKVLKAGGGTSFEAVALEWLEKFSAGWAKITRSQAESRLRNMVFPHIGKMEICHQGDGRPRRPASHRGAGGTRNGAPSEAAVQRSLPLWVRIFHGGRNTIDSAGLIEKVLSGSIASG